MKSSALGNWEVLWVRERQQRKNVFDTVQRGRSKCLKKKKSTTADQTDVE